MEGLVVRRQGRGTFVEARDPNVLQQRFRGSLGDLINESQRAKTRNVDVAHDAPIPVHIAEALQLDSPLGTIVKRTRIMDGQPFALTITYLPPDLGKTITPAGVRRKALMEMLMDSGISLSSASQSIRAQLADLEVCSQIDVERGAAVLFVERIVHDTAGRPVEYVRSWYRGDRYEYAVTLDLATGPDEKDPYRKLALGARTVRPTLPPTLPPTLFWVLGAQEGAAWHRTRSVLPSLRSLTAVMPRAVLPHRGDWNRGNAAAGMRRPRVAG
jgi:GntR family transcriptional regulator